PAEPALAAKPAVCPTTGLTTTDEPAAAIITRPSATTVRKPGSTPARHGQNTDNQHPPADRRSTDPAGKWLQPAITKHRPVRAERNTAATVRFRQSGHQPYLRSA